MNKRIVTWAAIACLSAYASTAGAVALGKIRALSALGEPLQINLALTDLGAVNVSDVRVVMASPEDYTRLGLIAPVGSEQWQVAMQDKDGLSASISGVAAQEEANISFLVKLVWPDNARVQQVTAVLLPVSTPTLSAVMTEPKLAVNAATTEAAVAGAATVTVAGVSSTVTKPASEPSAIEEIPVGPVTARVSAGDTLGHLAEAWDVPEANLLQRQLLLAERNPQIFIDGDINKVKRGAIVRYPQTKTLVVPDSAKASAWWTANQGVEASTALDQPALSAVPQASSDAADNEEVTLTLVNPTVTSSQGQSAQAEAAVADELAQLGAKKSALLAERAALQAELAALEKSGGDQDARLKVLDARLALLNTAAAEAPAEEAAPAASSTIRSSWVAAAIGLFLALLIIMRRRALAASAAASAARAEPVIPPGNDYVAFEPLETLPTPPWTGASVVALADVPETPAVPEVMPEADDEEEYDFLSDAESAALQTRLDLAQAYIDMQETDLAKELLLAVLARGNSEQRTQAASILDTLA